MALHNGPNKPPGKPGGPGHGAGGPGGPGPPGPAGPPGPGGLIQALKVQPRSAAVPTLRACLQHRFCER